MATDLTAIKAALGELSAAELHALIAASNGAPPIAYRLLVWIEDACGWKLNRPAGHDYELLPPDAAIDRVRERGKHWRYDDDAYHV